MVTKSINFFVHPTELLHIKAVDSNHITDVCYFGVDFCCSPYNGTMVYNRWLVRGPSTSRCYRFMDGGFSAAFNGTVILRGEYGGEEGIMASSGDSLLYGRDILYDSCNQQPIIFQTESLAPIRRVPGDGWLVVSLRIRNRQLGEGTTWGLTRITLVNPTTLLYESRQVYTFL